MSLDKVKKRVVFICTVLAVFVYSAPVWSQNNLYRYINDQGNTVLNHIVPPQYVQGGYDILNASGKLIKTVPPAPGKDEISRRETLKQFDKLYRRFRSVDEIDFAKDRVISDIDASISIVKSNIATIEKELVNQKIRAAAIERQGRNVPKLLLGQIASTQKELLVTKDLLATRQQEKTIQFDMYNSYTDLFNDGLKLKLEEHQLHGNASATR